MQKSKQFFFFVMAVAAGSYIVFETLQLRGEPVAPAGSGYTIIDAATADGLIDQKEVIVLDARPAKMYQEGHIRKAISLPLEEVEQKISQVAENKERTLLLYCLTQKRSAEAASILHSLGFKRLFVLAGGFSRWRSENRPIEAAGTK